MNESFVKMATLLRTPSLARYFYPDRILERLLSTNPTRRFADSSTNGQQTPDEQIVVEAPEELYVHQVFVKMSVHHLMICLPFTFYWNFEYVAHARDDMAMQHWDPQPPIAMAQI
jgi:hypothetical protein